MTLVADLGGHVSGRAGPGEPVPVVVRGEAMARAAEAFLGARAKHVAGTVAQILYLAEYAGVASDSVATALEVLDGEPCSNLDACAHALAAAWEDP